MYRENTSMSGPPFLSIKANCARLVLRRSMLALSRLTLKYRRAGTAKKLCAHEKTKDMQRHILSAVSKEFSSSKAATKFV